MLNCWIWRWKKRPLTKECRWLLESEEGKELDSPLEPPVGCSLTNTLTLGPLTSRTTRYEICFVLTTDFWQFVTAAIKNEYTVAGPHEASAVTNLVSGNAYIPSKRSHSDSSETLGWKTWIIWEVKGFLLFEAQIKLLIFLNIRRKKCSSWSRRTELQSLKLHANFDHRDLVLKSQKALMGTEDPMGTQFIPKRRIESG